VDTSYDAAAMLVTFVLFGHWMEMRSRLAPTQANLIGAGTDVAIETAEVVLKGVEKHLREQ
jgi:Cu2+-exporting ATPase